MRPVSDAFLRTLRGSHSMIARARVCTTFQTGTTPAGTVIPILGGNVQLDGDADIRSSLDLVTDGTGMWPSTGGSLLLAPYGNEVYVERGLRYSDDLVEYVGLGYFRIESPEQDTPPDGPIRLTGRDRMAGLIDARLLTPRQFLPADTLGDVVTDLVTEVYPDAVVEWDDATDTEELGRSLIAEEDRHGFVRDLVRSRGKVAYWDHRGVLVIRTRPDSTVPVWDVDAGPGGVLVSMSRQLTREGVYNAVVASGEATDYGDPVRAVAYDNNVLSPTFFLGRFGPVPKFYTSAFLTTPSQAAAAAEAELRRSLGLPYDVDLTAVPNPALEPHDPVRVRFSDRYAVETHVLDALTIPLTPGAVMSASTREQTVILIGASS